MTAYSISTAVPAVYSAKTVCDTVSAVYRWQLRERERELSVSRESISREYTQHRDHTAYRESQQNEWPQREHSMLKLVQPFHISDIIHREDQCDVSTALQLHNKSALLRCSSSDTQVRYIITL